METSDKTSEKQSDNKISEIYRCTSSMEPLLPDSSKHVLSELTMKIAKRAGELGGGIPDVTKRSIEPIVRQMNSYYSNLIEGHRTNPLEVEKALKKKYVNGSKQEEIQQLGVAHIKTEEWLTTTLRENPDINVNSPEFICSIHKQFYEKLPDRLRTVKDSSGREYPLVPGAFREYNVTVGDHVPPDYTCLSDFMNRFDSFYCSRKIIATRRLVAIAASHQRLLWIHPFGDGNGRVARLLSHAALIQCDLDSYGLWTLARGLARRQGDYYSHLAMADGPRINDYDGRGNLSTQRLAIFCQFFLETILDQIEFMLGVLEYDTFKHRIENLIYRQNIFGKHNDQGKYLLFEALSEGEYARGEAARLTGYKETIAREILQTALDKGLLVSDGPRSPVRLGFPYEYLDDIFPKLFMSSV